MLRFPILAAGLAPLALAACADPAPDPAGGGAPSAGEARAAGEMAERLNLAVQELSAEDIEAAALEGELGCSFAPRPGGETLFLGRGDVGRAAGAQGAIKLPDGLRVLAMRGRGGFDGMRDGARFEGEGLRVDITPASERALPEAPAVAGESPQVPAMLSVRSRGSEVAVQGVFECGP